MKFKKSNLISLIVATGFLIAFFGAVVSHAENKPQSSEANELLKLIKTPANPTLLKVKQSLENYTDKTEFQVLGMIRGFFDYSTQFKEAELQAPSKEQYFLLSSEFKAKSSTVISDWTKSLREAFSGNTISWKSGSSKTIELGYRDYVFELAMLSQHQIIGYLIDSKFAYIFVEKGDSNEVKIIELAWSDHNAPYFEGFYFLSNTDTASKYKSIVYSEEFISALQKFGE